MKKYEALFNLVTAVFCFAGCMKLLIEGEIGQAFFMGGLVLINLVLFFLNIRK